jgi:hypothetical protein
MTTCLALGLVLLHLAFCFVFFLLGPGIQRIIGVFFISFVHMCLPFWLRTQLLVTAHPACLCVLFVGRFFVVGAPGGAAGLVLPCLVDMP